MSLSEITLPPNLTEIGECAFYGCMSLSEITLPPNLTEIGQFAFSLERDQSAAQPCTSLTEITLPAGPVNIRNRALWGSGTPQTTSGAIVVKRTILINTEVIAV